MDKRTFMKRMTLAGLSLPFTQMNGSRPATLADLEAHVTRYNDIPAADLAQDDEFWTGIRAQYALKPDYINLENGYYNIQPTPILEAYMRHIKEVNYEGAYYMRTVQFERKKAFASRLASLAGCAPDEVVITRNTTESLDMLISGYPWKA